MRYASVCSGVEAASQAWGPLGWTPVWFSEIEKFPSELLKHRYPDVPNLGDMTKIVGGDYRGQVDLLVGGTPCFTGDTLVSAMHGLVPISTIDVGDMVLTHRGRFRKVIDTGHKLAETVRLKGCGLPRGVRTTMNHPFYSLSEKATPLEYPQWVPTKDMVGKHWASPIAWPVLPYPEIEHEDSSDPIDMNDSFWEMIGRIVRNGWIQSYVHTYSFKGDTQSLQELADDCGVRMFLSPAKGLDPVQFLSASLTEWCRVHFFISESSRTIPTWLLGQPENIKKAFLKGYMHPERDFAGTGKALAIGINLLKRSCGIMDDDFAFVTTDHCWGSVTDIEPCEKDWVYNITVEGDHSYVSDGIVCKNCQDLSVAGKRLGFEGERSSLALDFVRLAYESGARWLVWENVVGALSSTKGEDFAQLLSLFTGWDVAVPKKGWKRYGIVEGSPGCFGVAWRVLDVQYTRVDGFPRAIPQRRKRIILVGYLGDWRRAQEVLFESESVLGDTPPCREKREKNTEDVGGGVDSGCPIVIDRAAFNQGINALYEPHIEEIDVMDTLVARGPHAVAHRMVSFGEYKDDETASTIKCRDYKDAMDLVVGTKQQSQSVCYENHPNDSRVKEIGNLCPTITSRVGTGGGNLPLLVEASDTAAYSIHGTQDPDVNEELGHPVGRNGGRENAIIREERSSIGFQTKFVRTTGGQPTKELCSCIVANHNNGDGAPCVALAQNTRDEVREMDVVGSLCANSGMKQTSYIRQHLSVRRLTPLECERLMGFEDNWTQIPWNGKDAEKCPDSHRYKACGNSMGVNVMRWVGQRIRDVEEALKADPLEQSKSEAERLGFLTEA